MLHVRLARLDQIGKLIVALLEQNVDVRPVLRDRVLEADEIVVDGRDVYNRDGDRGEQYVTGDPPWPIISVRFSQPRKPHLCS